jgi:hypothetical protein
MIALLFNHPQIPLIFIIINPVNKSTLLFEEVLIFVINLRVVLALTTAHVLLLLLPIIHIIGITIVTIGAIDSLVATHIRSREHAHAAIKILVVFLSRHNSLACLLNFSHPVTFPLLDIATNLCIHIIWVVIIKHLMVRVHPIIISFFAFGI